jgi:hypothetical protein
LATARALLLLLVELSWSGWCGCDERQASEPQRRGQSYGHPHHDEVEAYSNRVSAQKRPDVRPELRELLQWYREAVERIEAGAIVEPGEEDRLREEAALVDELLQRLERTHESGSERD